MKHSVRVLLKNGSEFTVRCDDAGFERDMAGGLRAYSFDGVSDNLPLYLRMDEVAAVIQVADKSKPVWQEVAELLMKLGIAVYGPDGEVNAPEIIGAAVLAALDGMDDSE